MLLKVEKTIPVPLHPKKQKNAALINTNGLPSEFRKD